MSRLAPPETFRHPSRRALLSVGAAGLSVAMIGAPALAADPAYARRKFVVIICRGAMDGLSASPPVGDRDYAPLRGPIALPGFGQPGGALKLDDTFGLHPKLTTIHALAQAGEARIAPAVAIPVHIRSHFEAQDVLENGSDALYGASTGWMNRTLQAVSRAAPRKGLAVGAQEPLILRGPVETASWSPGGAKMADNRVIGVLQELYKHDPMLGPALASGLQTEAMAAAFAEVQASGAAPGSMQGGAVQAAAASGDGARVVRAVNAQVRMLGETTGKFLAAPDGPSLAAISLDGFDTHSNQGASEGQLAARLATLDTVVEGLKGGLGSAWSQTLVVVATEFGRTAHVNGTGGTDHGTAGTAFLLGGAIRRGGIVGDWPTLQAARLFENRDLAPTLDIRSLFKGVLADHVGVDRTSLDRVVFPNSAAAPAVSGLVKA